MRLFQKQHHGFTVIELLITITIAGIVVGGAIAGFVSFSDRQEVLNAAKEVQQMMRTAQSKARVREVPTLVGSEACKTLLGYQVQYLATPTKTFRIAPYCTTTNHSNGIIGASIDLQTIPTDITVAAPDFVRFGTLESGVSFPTSVSEVLVTLSKGTHSFTFSISASGNISNVEPTTP